MSYYYTISDFGLRLIKAYEGFNPAPLELPGGGYIWGFGHRIDLLDGEDIDLQETLSEADAETLLKDDLSPIESLVNNRVHAALTQSQFDALCSLAYSIGVSAFLSSDLLHALNQGRIIDAAHGFDQWLYGEFDNQTYMVDALVRRRTAEKALFLRPVQRAPHASRHYITPIPMGQRPVQSAAYRSDSQAGRKPALHTKPVLSETPHMKPSQESKRESVPLVLDKVVEPDIELDHVEEPLTVQTDYDETQRRLEVVADNRLYDDESLDVDETSDIIEQAITRQNDDGGIDSDRASVAINADNDDMLVLSTADQTYHGDAIETDASYDTDETSPIAQAAAEVSDRLDALIGRQDHDAYNQPSETEAWPDSLVEAHSPTNASQSSATIDSSPNVVELKQLNPQKSPDIIIDDLADDYDSYGGSRPATYGAERYIETTEMKSTDRGNIWAYITMIIVGLTAAVSGVGLSMVGSASIIGHYGPFITISAIILGTLLFLMGAYYLMKALFGRE